MSANTMVTQDQPKFDELGDETVELLPARTEMALVNLHVSGVLNGNKVLSQNHGSGSIDVL
jgi:hypothetical protein